VTILLLAFLFAITAINATMSTAQTAQLMRNTRAEDAGSGDGVTNGMRGGVGALLAAGVLNGFRVGAVAFARPDLSGELSLGWLSVQLIEEGERKTRTDGYTLTAAANWYSHPDAPVSPLLNFTATYIVADGARLQQWRAVLMATVGSDYTPTPRSSLFFRFGPAWQLLTTRGEASSEWSVQFDAGITYNF
jgi:hypothetical protein